MAGRPGFEPGLTESESVVLPLDDPPVPKPLSVEEHSELNVTIYITTNPSYFQSPSVFSFRA